MEENKRDKTPEEKWKSLKELVDRGDFIALTLASLGVGVVIVIFFALLMHKKSSVENENILPVEITYNIDIDTNKLKTLSNEHAVEYLKIVTVNNQKIVDEVNKTIELHNKRIQELVELKEEQNIYNTYGASIIAIILAIGSFFGFKSINQMRLDAIETAEIEAVKIASKEAKSASESIAESTASKIALAETRNQINLMKKDLETILIAEIHRSVQKDLDSIADKNNRELERMSKEFENLLFTGNKIIANLKNNIGNNNGDDGGDGGDGGDGVDPTPVTVTPNPTPNPLIGGIELKGNSNDENIFS